MIAQVKETVVEQKKWLSDEELMEIITVAESTPGPIAVNMATM
ncbi:MAG: chromate transporter [Lachnospiraceae bacterium]